MRFSSWRTPPGVFARRAYPHRVAHRNDALGIIPVHCNEQVRTAQPVRILVSSPGRAPLASPPTARPATDTKVLPIPSSDRSGVARLVSWAPARRRTHDPNSYTRQPAGIGL